MNDLPDDVLAPSERGALLVIDVQNDFCAPGGVFEQSGRDLTAVRATLPSLHRFLDVARQVLPTVIFVRSIYDDAYLSEAMRRRRQRKGVPHGHCQSGTWGADFFEVAPRHGERVVTKHRFSAFVDTDLPLLLRSRQISTLYHVGYFTNVCVESTARDAAMRDFEVVVVSDCAAALNPQAHEASLRTLDATFGYVADSDWLADAWGASA